MNIYITGFRVAEFRDKYRKKLEEVFYGYNMPKEVWVHNAYVKTNSKGYAMVVELKVDGKPISLGESISEDTYREILDGHLDSKNEKFSNLIGEYTISIIKNNLSRK